MVSFWLTTTAAFSQNVWTLEDCIKHALNNNIQIKQQQLNTVLAKYQYDQGIAALFPSINGSASHIYNNGQTIDMFTNEFATQQVQSNNFNLNASVVVFSGLTLLNNLKQKQLDFLAGQYDLEKMKNDIALTIATAYLQVLYNIELLEIAANQLEITGQQAARTRLLYDAGSIAKGNLLTIEAQLAQDELTKVNAQNQLDLAYLTLMQLLDLPSDNTFHIEQPDLALPDASSLFNTADDVFNKAVTIQPDVKGAEIRVKSAKKGLNASWGMVSPTITLSGSYGTGYSGASKDILDITQSGFSVIGVTASGESVFAPTYDYTYQKVKFWDQLDRNLNNSVGLYMSIPIFNKLQTYTSIRSSRLSLMNAELNLQNTKNQLYKTLQQAWADAKAALNRYSASVKSVDALKESFNYTQQKFDVGLLNSIDYKDAKNNLIKAQSDMLQAKYEYVFRIKVLDFYQGKPLTLK